LSALSVLLAATSFGYIPEILPASAELVAVYGIALILVLNLRSVSRSLTRIYAIAFATGVAVVSAAAILSAVMRSASWIGTFAAPALTAFALALLITLGVVSVKTARSFQIRTNPHREAAQRISGSRVVRRPGCATNPAVSPQKARNDGAVKHGWKTASSAISDGGKVRSGSISVTLSARRRDQR